VISHLKPLQVKWTLTYWYLFYRYINYDLSIFFVIYQDAAVCDDKPLQQTEIHSQAEQRREAIEMLSRLCMGARALCRPCGYTLHYANHDK